MDNKFVEVINQIKVILGIEKVQVKFSEDKLKDGTPFYYPDGLELVEGTDIYTDPEMTIPMPDGKYEMETKKIEILGGLITKIETETPETETETPETETETEVTVEVEQDIVADLTAQIENLKIENEKLKKICADNEIDITNLKSDIEKFKSNEFKMKKEIEKLGNEPVAKSLNKTNLTKENKKGTLESYNETRTFLNSIVN